MKSKSLKSEGGKSAGGFPGRWRSWVLWALLALLALLAVWGGFLWKPLRDECRQTLVEYGFWGKFQGSGRWPEDTRVSGLERVSRFIKPGDLVGVPVAVYSRELENQRDVMNYRNAGAQVGWFLHTGQRVEPARADEDYGGADVVLSRRKRYELEGDRDWRLIYADPNAQLYRRLPPEERKADGEAQRPTMFYEIPYASGPAWPGVRALARRIGLVLVSAGVSCGIGYWFLRLCGAGFGTRMVTAALSLVCGSVLTAAGCLVALLAGMKGMWVAPVVTAGLIAAGMGAKLWLERVGRPRHPQPGRLCYRGQACGAGWLWVAFSVFAAWMTLRSDAHCIAGLGHYGYKAKVFFEEGWPADSTGGPGWILHVPDYPLGASLQWLWEFSWMSLGEPDSPVRDWFHVARITQGIWLGCGAVLMAAWLSLMGAGRFLSAAVSFAVLLTPGLLFFTTSAYPEPLMMALFWAGMLFLTRGMGWSRPAGLYAQKQDAESRCGRDARDTHSRDGCAVGECLEGRRRPQIWLGINCLGAMCAVKTEGVFLLLAASVFLLLSRERHRVAAPLAAAWVVWVVLWRLYLWANGVTLGDFDPRLLWEKSLTDHAGQAVLISEEVVRYFLEEGRNYGWFWFALLLALPLGRRRGSEMELRFLCVCLSVYFLSFCGVYLLSNLPLEWHLNGLSRMFAFLAGPVVAVGVAARHAGGPRRYTGVSVQV